MDTKNQIEKWLQEGIISQDQAARMMADTIELKKDETSNKLVVTISIIGSVLLGIGAILFIASNWAEMSNSIKVLLLVGSTFGSYFAGYYFKYQKKNLPLVGASLIFLGALLFGATIFLIAQMYHVNADSHSLVLIWLAGIIPLVYVFSSEPIAVIASMLFYVWIGLFVFQGMEFEQAQGDFFRLPVLYLVSGVLMFGIGSIHYFSNSLKGIARIYRLIAIKVGMLSLFLLTFRFFSGYYEDYSWFNEHSLETSSQFTIGFVVFSIVSIILVSISYLFNPSKSSTNKLENLIALGLTGLGMVFFFFPIELSNFYVVVFNLALVGIVFILLFVGYHREDMSLVNTGMSWFFILILVRYFDFFWDLLPRSLFFMVGGLVLVLGGIAMERERRLLKLKFASQQTIQS